MISLGSSSGGTAGKKDNKVNSNQAHSIPSLDINFEEEDDIDSLLGGFDEDDW